MAGRPAVGRPAGRPAADHPAVRRLEPRPVSRSRQTSSAASVAPPGGLAPANVPQFIMFGSDDNYYADGVNWLASQFAGKNNPDGTPAQITYFITSGGATTDNGGVFTAGDGNEQTEQDVLTSWQNMYSTAGHEIGVHTWDHDKSDGTPGSSYVAADWQAEVTPAVSLLTGQAGMPACELDGWRFPYLVFNEAGFQTISSSGFLFDTSVEFGYNWWDPAGANGSRARRWIGRGMWLRLRQLGLRVGGNFWWPMTLENGFPSVADSGFA